MCWFSMHCPGQYYPFIESLQHQAKRLEETLTRLLLSNIAALLIFGIARAFAHKQTLSKQTLH